MPRVNRKDLMLAPVPVKEEMYEEIHKLYKSGIAVSHKEHRSGFPAITVDCGDIHILTDCLSLEDWWAKKKEAGQT
ncbi:hypothetical protein ES703_66622 [subsurface metagenome]